MRLLFIHTNLGKGGITTVLINKLNYLAENTNFELVVLTENKSELNFENRLNKKIKFSSLQFEPLKKNNLFQFYYDSFIRQNRIKKALQKFIDNSKPDIITSFIHGYSIKLLPKINTDAVKVIEFHMPQNRFKMADDFAKNNRIKRWLRKVKFKFIPFNLFLPSIEKSINRFDYGISLTKRDLEARNSLKIKKIQIYNSIKLPQHISEFQNRDKVIIAIGALIPTKNFHDLIKSISFIKDDLINWEVHIYGDGFLRNVLQDQISKNNLTQIIKLRAFTPDIFKVYNNAKLMVSTSISEGQPMSILESLSFKIPVICYNCDYGPSEMISDGENGYIIDFHPNILAEKIKELITDNNKLNRFSENTQSGISRFNENNIMPKWIEFYSEAVNHLSRK